MNLNEHDGKFIDMPGTYNLIIFTSKVNGREYVDFETKCSETGKDYRLRIYLAENQLWILTKLAKACGLTREELNDFKPTMLHGKDFRVELEQNGDYLRANAKSFGPATQASSAPAQKMVSTPGAAPSVTQQEDDLPF